LYSNVLLKKTELEREITERQLAEEALRESEERFRSLFDNLSVGVATIERDGRVSAVNKTVCHFLNYSQEEVIGMPLSELIYPEDLDIE
jgi:PAS domain S-box-containing protein